MVMRVGVLVDHLGLQLLQEGFKVLANVLLFVPTFFLGDRLLANETNLTYIKTRLDDLARQLEYPCN